MFMSPFNSVGEQALLTFAIHPVIPVHEGTVWVVPPSPDVQLEVCGQAVPVRAANQ